MQQAAPLHDGDEQCVFCSIFASDLSDEEAYIIWRNERTVVICNAFPYASGHLMVMPRRHLASLDELSAEESSEIWELLVEAVATLKATYGPDGINVGANLGAAAGAGIPDHLHLHALPRWRGDTNFMTSVAETRVLPESLAESWRRVKQTWEDRAVYSSPQA